MKEGGLFWIMVLVVHSPRSSELIGLYLGRYADHVVNQEAERVTTQALICALVSPSPGPLPKYRY